MDKTGNNIFLTQKMEPDFVSSRSDYEHYVLVNSSAFGSIYGEKINETNKPDTLEGLVKVSFNGHSVYRKAISRCFVKKDKVQMGYRTHSELGIKDVNAEHKVQIVPANWFKYLWFNYESYVKQPFRVAVLGLVITIFSFIISVLSLFINVPN